MVQTNDKTGGTGDKDAGDWTGAHLTAEDQRYDKLGLFILAALLISVLGGVVLGLFTVKKLDPVAAGIVGGIVTGVLTRLGDTMKLISESWAGVQWKNMTNKLATSTPKTEEPQEVKVINTAKDAVPTVEGTKDGNPWDGEGD